MADNEQLIDELADQIEILKIIKDELSEFLYSLPYLGGNECCTQPCGCGDCDDEGDDLDIKTVSFGIRIDLLKQLIPKLEPALDRMVEIVGSIGDDDGGDSTDTSDD